MLSETPYQLHHFRVSLSAQDKFKVPNAFWIGLKLIGLTPGAVLRHSNLPLTIYDGEKNLVSTAQFFAIWRAVGELTVEQDAGLKLASRIEVEHYHPSSLAALHARTLRDALSRMARYKQLCCAEEMRIAEGKTECVIEFSWPFAEDPEPPLLTDAAFAAVAELGRRGTKTKLCPKRVELKRAPDPTQSHELYFQCPVKYGARRNVIILRTSDLDLPFVTHNADLIEMLTPQLDRQLAGRKAQAKIVDQVKWVLKRLLSGSRPDILLVAKELGMGARTLQRRITDEGASFRQLLNEARQELVRQYLRDPAIEINETAFLLGYEDPNSFYRAFRTWEGTTPAHWRSTHQTAAAHRN
jgi:AraC-like DNA-binding protein